MASYKVTGGIADTVANIQAFVKANHNVFLDILKPLLPYIIALHMFDALLNMAFPDAVNGEGITVGGFFASYFYICLTISWHRVVILGPNKAEPMNPFKPQKHELAFIGTGFMIIFLGITLAIGLVVAAIFSNAILIILSLIVLLPMIYYAALRLLFYFPAKAVGDNLSLREAFHLSKGYFWRLIITPFLASILLILAVIGYYIVFGIVMFALAFIPGNAIFALMTYILLIPIVAYTTPLGIIIGVTSLSNFYLHAVQNRSMVKG